METQSWSRYVVVTVLAGALLHLFIGLVVLRNMPQTEDGPSYERQAVEIMRGDAEYFFFPPGTALVTSAFYSVFGFTSTVSHVVATLFWIGFACSSAWFAWLVLDDKKAAWIASVFGSFLPHSLLATTTLSSQPFAATLVTLACCFGIYALQRRSLLYWSLLSIALSLAAITRPAVLLLSVFAAAILLFGWHRSYVTLRSCLVALVVLVVAHLAIIIPVVQHNVEQRQGYTISTNNEWNLLVGNNPYTPDYKTGHFGQRTFDQLPDEVRTYFRTAIPHEQPAFATLDQRSMMQSMAVEYIADHPGRFLYRLANRFRCFWGMDYTASRELQNVYGFNGFATASLLVIEGGAYVLITLLAFFYVGLRQENRYMPLILIVVALSLAPYLVAFSVAKYHTIVLPLLFPLSAAMVVWISKGFSDRQLLRKRWYTLVIIAVIYATMQIEHAIHIVDNQ